MNLEFYSRFKGFNGFRGFMSLVQEVQEVRYRDGEVDGPSVHSEVPRFAGTR